MEKPFPAVPAMHALTSSNIEAVGHDGAHLHVRFTGGAHYSYEGAPASLADELRASPSPGALFARQVRNAYPARKHPS